MIPRGRKKTNPATVATVSPVDAANPMTRRSIFATPKRTRRPSIAVTPGKLGRPSTGYPFTPRNGVIDPEFSDHELNNESIINAYTVKLRAPTKVKKTRSYVWKYGKQVEALVKGEWVEKWACRLCPESNPQLYCPDTTSHIKGHLQDEHGIEPDVTVAILAREDCAINTAPRFEIDGVCMKSRLVQWICVKHHAFQEVESDIWRDFMSTFHQDALNALPSSADTVRSWTMAIFKERRRELAAALTTMKSKVHISFDGWTSGNGLALLGVVGYWLDSDCNFNNALLGVREVQGRHTGETLANCISKVFDDFGLPEDRIGWYILDNATNNDTAVDVLVGEDDSDSRRLRCLGHIIHLVVKVLFSLSSHENEFDEDRTNKWNRHIGVRKLHKIAKFIRRSPFQKAEWKRRFTKMILSDNPTRWSSIANMLESVDDAGELDRFLRDAALEATNAADRKKITAMRITPDEFQVIRELSTILKPFRQLTEKLQGNAGNKMKDGSIADVLPAMEFLLNHIDVQRKHFAGREDCVSLVEGLDAAWDKLCHYYQATDVAPVYIVAVVCDPRRKFKWFEQMWKKTPEWIEVAKTKLLEFYEGYRDKSSDRAHGNNSDGRIITFESWPYTVETTSLRSRAQVITELDDYLSTSQIELDEDPWEYLKANRNRWPTVVKMAFDVLAIPAMSAEPERVFSSAKDTATDRRNALKAETIESCECLRHWFKRGLMDKHLVIKGSSTGFVDV